MNMENVDAAVVEAKRFLNRVEQLSEADRSSLPWGSKESGAVRRSSMDLTRALAEMRRPG